MEKVIYSKCSNDRADEFNIITQIVKKNNDERKVIKKPANNMAAAHVSQIAKNYMKLKEAYKDTDIRFAKAVEKKNTVEIEWVEGNDFASYLDILLEQNKIDECIHMIKSYFQQMFENNRTQDTLTDQFYATFGLMDCKFDGLVKNIDIDILFSNVIYDGKVWVDYDYEWFIDYPVPEKFVIYRCLLYYITNTNRSRLLDVEIYEKFGITQGEQSIFKQMEENFQKYIEKEHVPMWKLYRDIHGKVIDVKPIEERLKRKGITQIFYDFGRGYNEADSECIILDEYEKNQYFVRVKIPEKAKEVRFDPVWSACIIELNRIEDERGKTYNFTTNGVELAYNKFLFFHDDPQIIIKDIIGKEEVILDYNLIYIDCEDDSALGAIDVIFWNLISKAREKEQIEKQNQQYEKQIEQLISENGIFKTQNAKQQEQVDRLIEDNKSLIKLRDELLEIRDGLAQVQMDLTYENCTLKDKISSVKLENDELKKLLEKMKQDNEMLNDRLEEIENSLTWKITKPMRYVKNKIQKTR